MSWWCMLLYFFASSNQHTNRDTRAAVTLMCISENAWLIAFDVPDSMILQAKGLLHCQTCVKIYYTCIYLLEVIDFSYLFFSSTVVNNNASAVGLKFAGKCGASLTAAFQMRWISPSICFQKPVYPSPNTDWTDWKITGASEVHRKLKLIIIIIYFKFNLLKLILVYYSAGLGEWWRLHSHSLKL